jgi:hypothetical protein
MSTDYILQVIQVMWGWGQYRPSAYPMPLLAGRADDIQPLNPAFERPFHCQLVISNDSPSYSAFSRLDNLELVEA